VIGKYNYQFLIKQHTYVALEIYVPTFLT
jgi:hypothetical protein